MSRAAWARRWPPLTSSAPAGPFSLTRVRRSGAQRGCATWSAASRQRLPGMNYRIGSLEHREMSGFTAPHCGSLRAEDAGKEVELYGWVARRRDHGGVTFIDLRDRWGIVQVVLRAAPADLRNEYVVHVTGSVRRRPAGSENPKLATGDVEVEATSVEVITAAKTPPFEIVDDVAAAESTRLKYRYLDIRRPKMARTLELRHRVVQAIHRYMSAHEFIEIETPMLLKGTPEGSRDFVVPSRLHPGEFFALPQSPQQLKQLLMVGGIGRYYQIAR